VENRETFKELFNAWVKRPGAAELLAWLESTDFFEAPASTKYHGAYPGGLLEHSLNVCRELMASDINRSASTESMVICSLLHDVCKANYYAEIGMDGDGKTLYQVIDQFPFGHGEKSVFLISQFMRMTDEEALAIRWHMGPYDEAAGSYAYKDARRYAKFRWPMVIAFHDADMTATQKGQREEKGGGAGNEKDA